MSYVLRIRPVSNKSKADVLREFGHRVFVEIDNDNKPIRFFVETTETAGIASSKPQPGRRSAVTGNVALVWAGREFHCKKPDSMYAKIAEAAKEFAAIPTRRSELVEAIEKDALGKYQGTTVTNAISRLTVEGYLVVPG